MHLVLLQIKVPNILVIRNMYADDAVVVRAVVDGDVTAEIPGLTATAGAGQLEPGHQPVPLGIFRPSKNNVQFEKQILGVYDLNT